MTTYWCRVQGNVVVEDPVEIPDGLAITDCYAPPIAAQFFQDPTRQAKQGWTFTGSAFVAPGAVEVSKPQSITATQFLNRIPQQILPVLYSNPQTGVMLITLAAAQMIDLTDPQVQGGINALVPDILTADQAAAILDH